MPDGCLFQYGTPVVTQRQVGFGGSTPSQIQSFTYKTTWGTNPPTAWTTKVTTVTTQDVVTGKSASAIYTYGSRPAPRGPFDISATQPPITGQIPVEQTIQYDGFNSNLLRTVSKVWYDQYNLQSEQTVLNDSNQSSQTIYCYVGTNCKPNLFLSQLQEKDEYDYGATAPTRETVTTYQSFPGTLGALTNLPCKTVISGSGVSAETDYLYDGGATVCGLSGTPAVADAGGTSLTNHDEANFSAGSQIPRGNLTKKTQLLAGETSPVTSYTYDETGQVTSITDPNMNVTQYHYNDEFVSTNTNGFTTTAGSPPTGKVTNAYLTQIVHPPTNGVQHTEEYTYGYNDGQLTTSTDQNGQVTTYRYDDGYSRPTEVDSPDSGITTTSYQDGNPPAIQTSKKLNSSSNCSNFVACITTSTLMDGVGHVVSTDLMSDPKPDLTTSTYNGMGLLASRSNPFRPSTPGLSTDGTTSYVYDGLGRTCLVIPPGGTAAASCPTSPLANDIFTSYFGNCTTVTDAAGKSRKSCTDALGRLTSVSEDPNGLNYETDYQYNALDDLMSVMQKGGNSQGNWRTRTFTYNSLSRLLSATNPESGTITYSYDPNGNLISKTDARGITTTMTYDALNRVLTKSYSDGTPAATFYYDRPPAPWANIELYTNGRLVEQTTGITPESK